MKRLPTMLVMLVALVVPATASAVPFTIQKHGIGLRASTLNGMYGSEQFAAAVGPFSVRAVFDRCDGATPPYAGKVGDLAASGIKILPVVYWGNCAGKTLKINTAQEIADWQNYVGQVVDQINFMYALNGQAPSNLLEIWNEPNNPDFGGYDLAEYHQNVYSPARSAARAHDGDIGTLYGGMCFGNSGPCNRDASAWINMTIDRGYTGINGYAVHPYGLTNGAGVRNGARTLSQAVSEYGTACGASTRVTGRSMWVTETGYPSFWRNAQGQNISSDAAQASWLSQFNAWLAGARLVNNWIGKAQDDAPPVGQEHKSIGIIYANAENGKPAAQTWTDIAQPAYNGNTDTPCR